jgi:transcriptional regulator with XRE-family HTH domain
MALSDLIRRRRRELGLTQKQVGAACGVSHGAVAQWEGSTRRDRGKPNRPSYDRLRDLAAVLQLDMAQLIGETKPRPAMLAVTDARELALLDLWRRLSVRQQETHLSLFYVSAGVREPEPVQGGADPAQGLRRTA